MLLIFNKFSPTTLTTFTFFPHLRVLFFKAAINAYFIKTTFRSCPNISPRLNLFTNFTNKSSNRHLYSLYI